MCRNKVDIEKIVTLAKAGWRIERIAYEMRMEPDSVYKIISEYVDKNNKNAQKIQEIHTEKEGKQEKEISFILLTEKQLRDIYEKAAAIGAKEAMKAFEQERRKANSNRGNKRLRNTKLLLRNYHMLKTHAENSVFGRTQMEESALDVLESMMSMYDNEIIIESIKRSVTRTAIIVSHIEAMFELYMIYCDKSSNRDVNMRRYEVLWDRYMAEDTLSVKEIAEKQNISTRNVYEDIKVSTEKLSALIFGVDGLKVH